MFKLFEKIINFFLLPENQIEESKKPYTLYQDIDTKNLSDIIPEVITDYSGYWWSFKVGEIKNEDTVFTIDSDTITDAIYKKIEAGEFPIIEIPSTLMDIMEQLQNPDFIYGEISNMVLKSPGLSVEFIKIANSALYSRGHETSDLISALPRLGKENIRALLYMYSSKVSFAEDRRFNILAEQIIEHSYATGLIAGYMSQRFFADSEMAFLAGLLHNIGKLGILKALPDVYEFPKETETDLTEKSFDGIFTNLYEKAGAYLAKDWKIEKHVLIAIEHHNDYEEISLEDEISTKLCALIDISSLMARMLGFGKEIDKDVDLFSSIAAMELNIELNNTTISFLEDIPKIVSLKI